MRRQRQYILLITIGRSHNRNVDRSSKAVPLAVFFPIFGRNRPLLHRVTHYTILLPTAKGMVFFFFFLFFKILTPERRCCVDV